MKTDEHVMTGPLEACDERALLRAYVREKSQDAFGKLVERYVDLVYSAAMRQVREAAMADDVTQAVFILLAKKARWLTGKVMLGGWLLRVTRFAARDAMKIEARRRHHEWAAAALRPYAQVSGEEQRSSGLDEALARLREGDRDAIVLRYLEEKSPEEVARSLRITEATARQRCSRAIRNLRKQMQRQDAAGAPATMGAVLGAGMLRAAPRAVVHAARGAGAMTGKLAHAAGAGHVIAHAAAKSLAATKIAAVGAGVAMVVGTAGVAYTVHKVGQHAESPAPAAPVAKAAPLVTPPVAPAGMPRTVTPLIWAIERHDAAQVRQLVLAGADVNAVSTDGNNTSALLYAVTYTRDEELPIVQLLVEHGADVNMRHGQMGYTALTVAVGTKSIKTLQYLLAHGADPSLRSKKGESPLDRARARSDAEMIQALMDAGVK